LRPHLPLIFAAAALAGGAIDPDIRGEHNEMTDDMHKTGMAENSGAMTSVPGLAVAEDGLRLIPHSA
jgi:hypothetical protein